MARTNTKTSTKTYTRIAVLKANIELLLVRLANNMNKKRCKLFLEEVDNKSIKRFKFYGRKLFKNEYFRYVELDVNIDWELHDKYILSGEIEVDLPDNEYFAGGITPDISAVMNVYLKIVDEYELNKSFSVIWSDDVCNKQNEDFRANLRKKLGLVKGSDLKWYGEKPKHTKIFTPIEIEELTAELSFVNDTEK